jgi:Domain of unknown function (DUF1990)
MAEVLLTRRIDPQRELARLRTKTLNFNPERHPEHAKETGWHIDDYAIQLPHEPPGPPIKSGPWEIARKLSTAYRFVDPNILRAFYDPGEDLRHRTMLLEIHFWGLRIYAGVRVGDVFEGQIERQGRPAHVHTWNYRTLETHFEMGQIGYEICKWLDSGEIEFRIHAYSRRADPDNLLVRIGFLLFGRRRQVDFAIKACERMLMLTREALAGRLDVDQPMGSGLTERLEPPEDGGGAKSLEVRISTGVRRLVRQPRSVRIGRVAGC